jgi:glycosyltransferase involved in cell wall biosynthesis
MVQGQLVKQKPLVSVIMNCYNGEKYLKEAIESVLAQTYQNYEIIFWDNQSTDHSVEIFKSFSDPKLKYFYAPKHTKLYEARNCAIEKATGEFFAFLDVDDWWAPEKLVKQVPLFEDSEVGLVCSNFWIVNEHKRKLWKKHKQPAPIGWVLDDLLENYFVGILTLIVRRSALNSLSHPFDSRYHIIGDLDLVVRLGIQWKLDCVHEPVAYYRQHGNSESHKHRELQVDEWEIWIKEMSEIESVRSSPGWYRMKNEYVFTNALNQVILGNKKKAYDLSKNLLWGQPKIKLLLSLLFPTSYIQQRFKR